MELDELQDVGINIENTQKEVFTENRYLVIIEVIKDKKKYAFSNKTPEADLKEAKRKALSKSAFKVSNTDILTMRVLEIQFADVPVDQPLSDETYYNVEPIYSRWLLPEEIKAIITTK